ncbi:thymidylate kinase [Neoconidiobolus thromboides FSU 785]|nr:thymidylate kinase [Neoconidiobolus thromboides FSU 785]
MTLKRGLMIVFEGCDRAGKSTQTELLAKYFTQRNLEWKLVKFPDRTSISGKMINSYLQGEKKLNDQAIHLLFSANRWEVIHELKSMLDDGINLIVDRYAFSGAAFTAAKGLDLEWCKACDKGLLSPDLIFFLDIDNQTMKTRKDFGGEIYEKLDFQMKVREKFELIKESHWKFIDAKLSIQDVHEHVVTSVESALKVDNIPCAKYNLWLN